MTVRVAIKEIAEKQEKTRADVSFASHVSQNTIGKYWTGHQRRVDLDVLEKIARALGVPALSLLRETPD